MARFQIVFVLSLMFCVIATAFPARIERDTSDSNSNESKSSEEKMNPILDAVKAFQTQMMTVQKHLQVGSYNVFH